MSDKLKDPRPENIREVASKYRKVLPPKKTAPDAVSGKSTPAGRVTPVTAGIEPYTGSWGAPQITHLLRRTLFGVTKANLNTFLNLTQSQALAAVITTSPTPNPPVNDYDATDTDVPFGSTWINAPYNNPKEGNRILSLKAWLINNMINQQPTIHEKMIYFWHNLLVTQSWSIFLAKASYSYFNTLRNNALTNYAGIVKAITIEPAMLLYLNGFANNKTAPDENYARELQELFCIGKGPDSKYTEADVHAAARVLTGWTIDWNSVNTTGPAIAIFNSSTHDSTDKIFSAFYNNTIIAGQTLSAGSAEADELLTMIFNTIETSRYICRRLYSFFVYSEIDATTETNVIRPLADVLVKNNYDITPMLQVLFNSAHFYDSQNMGALIKSPLDALIGLWRTLGIGNPVQSDISMSFQLHDQILWSMAGMGQELGDPPNVAGWPAYYQLPEYDKLWITTDTIGKRASTNDSLLLWGFWGPANSKITADLLSFAHQLNHPEDPNQLLQEAAQLLLGLDPDPSVLTNLKSILLSGQATDYYWTSAWNDYITYPTNTSYQSIVRTRLANTFQQLLQMGEYQLM